MNASTFFQAVLGVAQAIVILTVAPESVRQREITKAKRNIQIRNAKTANFNAEVEAELESLKAEMMTLNSEVKAIAQPEIEQPTVTPEIIPNPWELPVEPKTDTAPIQSQHRHLTLCLPPAKEPTEVRPTKTNKTTKTAKKPSATKAKTKAKTTKKVA